LQPDVAAQFFEIFRSSTYVQNCSQQDPNHSECLLSPANKCRSEAAGSDGLSPELHVSGCRVLILMRLQLNTTMSCEG